MQKHYQPFVSQIRPTLATLPNFAADLTKPAAPAVKLNYARSDFVTQVRPTLAALPAPAGFELAFVAPKARPPRFAPPDFVNQVRPTLAALPAPAGFELCFVAPLARPQRFAKPDFVNQVRPTLAALPAPAGFELAFVARPAQPPEYVPATFVGSDKTIPTVVSSLLGAWLANVANEAVVLVYAQPDTFTLASLSVAVAIVGRLVSSSVRLGGTPPVPMSYVASPVIPAGASVATVPTLIFTTEGRVAVVLAYAQPDDFSSQVNPTLATLPSLADLVLTSQRAFAPTYRPSSWSAPEKMSAGATVLLTAPWFNNDGLPALKFAYAGPTVSAPDKMIGTGSATPTLAQWLATNGLAAVVLKYAAGSFVAPDKMVAATVTQLFTRADYSQVRLGGTPPVPKHFQASAAPVIPTVPFVIPTGVSFVSTDGAKAIVLVYAPTSIAAPDKVIIVIATTFLPGWMSTDGRPSQPQEYAQGSIVEPDKANLVTVATTFLPGWTSTDGRPAVKFVYAKGDWSAPDKMTAAVVLAPVYSWRGEDPYVPKWDWYIMGDTLTGPATIASAQQAFASANLAAKALTQKFQSVPNWTGVVLPIVTAPLPLFASGLADVAPVAQPLQYAQSPELTAPDKFGQVVAAQAFLPGWMSTDGPPAVLLDYVKSDTFVGPDKANLVTVATTFLSQWLSTLGLPAVTLRYPRPEALVLPLPSLLFAVSRSLGTPYEALGRVASSKIINYEALGKLQSAVAENYEALSRVSSALKGNYEFLKGLNQSRGVNEELLKGLFPPRIVNYEAKGTVLRQLTSNYEASGRLFAKLTENYEVLKGAVSQAKVSPYELLKGIAALETTFEEARGQVKSLGLSPYEIRLLGLAFALALDSAVLFQALTVNAVIAGDQFDAPMLDSASVVPALTIQNVIVGS